jgi:hypothetical protein
MPVGGVFVCLLAVEMLMMMMVMVLGGEPAHILQA